MKHCIPFLCLLLSVFSLQAKPYEVVSPSGRLAFRVDCGAKTTWSLAIDGVTVTSGNRLGMELALPGGGTQVLGDKAVVRRAVKSRVRGTVEAPLYRQKNVPEEYNALTLQMKGGYAVELRAYDEGVAYRFVTSLKDSLTVRNEIVEFHTSGIADSYIPYQHGGFRSNDKYECSFESEYTVVKAGEAVRDNCYAFLPILTRTAEKGNLLLMEADILDYPGMYVQTEADCWSAVFPPIPNAFKYSWRYNQRRSDYSDIIARTSGTRSFPWRIIGFAPEDKDLPVNNLSWLLGTPSRIEDTSWITAGYSSWDWWNDFKLTGVDFACGINTATYMHHIDFAATYGLKYVILDEGWYDAPDMLNPIPEIDMKALCEHAAEKGVKLILWSTGGLVDMLGIDKVFDHYKALGVAGFKLDFFDGQDQLTVKQITALAQSAADHQLVLDLHGMYKPAGLNRTFPNLLGFEGVYGEENLSRGDLDMPLYDVTFPYIRQVSGPTDYTPGAMRSAARHEPVRVARAGASQGTRSHQVALYVVVDQPLGILCDSPSLYEKEPLTTSYIASIPTVFDKTFVPCGRVGEYIVMARQKDGAWYLGGITNWDARDVNVDLSFLGEGSWKAIIYRDGANADRYGDDFIVSEAKVSAQESLPMHMAPGGGFAVIFTKE